MPIDPKESIARAEAAVADVKSPAEALIAYPPHTWFHSVVLSDGTRVDAPIKPLDVLQLEFDAFFSGVDFHRRLGRRFFL